MENANKTKGHLRIVKNLHVLSKDWHNIQLPSVEDF